MNSRVTSHRESCPHWSTLDGTHKGTNKDLEDRLLAGPDPMEPPRGRIVSPPEGNPHQEQTGWREPSSFMFLDAGEGEPEPPKEQGPPNLTSLELLACQ